MSNYAFCSFLARIDSAAAFKEDECMMMRFHAEAEDTPWASKTSVHALLNADLPERKPTATAGEEEEDPMALMIKQKKQKRVTNCSSSHEVRY